MIALSPGDLDDGAIGSFLHAVGRALEAGLKGLLLRERRLSDRSFGALLEGVVERSSGLGVWLGVHDRAHVYAASAEAPNGPRALHVGFRSLPPALAREVVGPAAAIGLSTHAGDDESSWSRADYLFHGPLRATPSKEGLVEPVGFDGLRDAVRRADQCGGRPLWAIGGILPDDAGAVAAAGASGVAVLRGILSAPDPGAATRAYNAAWATRSA